MLDNVKDMLDTKPDPFSIYFQNYICNIQDSFLDEEVYRSYQELQKHDEITQLKKLQQFINKL